MCMYVSVSHVYMCVCVHVCMHVSNPPPSETTCVATTIRLWTCPSPATSFSPAALSHVAGWAGLDWAGLGRTGFAWRQGEKERHRTETETRQRQVRQLEGKERVSLEA